jgi:hypothetical protein
LSTAGSKARLAKTRTKDATGLAGLGELADDGAAEDGPSLDGLRVWDIFGIEYPPSPPPYIWAEVFCIDRDTRGWALQIFHNKRVTCKLFLANKLRANQGLFAPYLLHCPVKYSCVMSYGHFALLCACRQCCDEIQLEMIVQQGEKKMCKGQIQGGLATRPHADGAEAAEGRKARRRE